MADFPDPVDSFLKSFFMVRNGTMDRQLKLQNAKLAQDKFSAEQANHQADMAQRAQQFKDEMDLRTRQQSNTEAYQKAMLDETKATRADASQRDFRDRGGIFQAPATDQPLPYQTGGSQGPGQQSLLPQVPGLTVPPQPVGPAAAQMAPEAASQNIIQGLPGMKSPVIPMQGTLGAEAQGPDPTLFNKVTPPMGSPAGQEAYLPTILGKAQQEAAGKKAANQIEWTPEMAAAMPEYGLKPHEMVDQTMLPLFEKHLDFKAQQLQHDREFNQGEEFKADQAARDRDLKMALAQISAQKKEAGGLSPAALDNAVKSVMQNPDNFETHSPKTREAIENELEDKFGLPAPTKLSTQNKSQETAALNSKAQIQTFENMLKDPDIQKNIGPAIGRYEDLVQGKIGSTAGFTPEVAQKVQQFRSALTYMLFSEGKQLMPGRISSQLIGLLKETSPNPRQALPILNGSLAAVKGNANNFLTAAEKERWGGKMRPDFIQNLYPERTPVKVGDEVKKSIRPGAAINVGGHNIYHDPDDDKFYEVPK